MLEWLKKTNARQASKIVAKYQPWETGTPPANQILQCWYAEYGGQWVNAYSNEQGHWYAASGRVGTPDAWRLMDLTPPVTPA